MVKSIKDFLPVGVLKLSAHDQKVLADFCESEAYKVIKNKLAPKIAYDQALATMEAVDLNTLNYMKGHIPGMHLIIDNVRLIRDQYRKMEDTDAGDDEGLTDDTV